mgnify:CR=1 FL=1
MLLLKMYTYIVSLKQSDDNYTRQKQVCSCYKCELNYKEMTLGFFEKPIILLFNFININ